MADPGTRGHGEGPAIVRAGRRTLQVSRPAKILFPDDGITKLALAEYYAVAGSVMLPHVRGPPVAMERYPNGLGGHRFYRKNVGGSVP
jgi:bifunctional non-homologous end joining protein LigD